MVIERPDRRTVTPHVVAMALAMGVLATLVARATLMPDVGRWDTAEAQTVPPILGTMHPTGYPAYVALGWLASVLLAPLGPTAFAMNLLSAILLGVAAGATVVIGRLLTGWTLLGVAAGIGATLTPIVWRLGVRADVHALHLALMALLLLTLVAWERAVAHASAGGIVLPGDRSLASAADRWLVAAAVVFGVALADHRLALLFGPGVVIYGLVVQPGLLRRLRFVLGLGLISLVVGAVFYLLLPIRAGLFPAPLVYGHPDTPLGFLQIVLGTQFGGDVTGPLGDLPAKVGALAALVAEQFGHLALVLPIAWLVTLVRRPGYALLTGSTALLTWLFAASYDNADILRYYAVPGLMAWTWLVVAAGWVVDVVARAPRPRSGAVGVVLAGVAAVLLLAPIGLTLPARWASVDATGDTVGRRWLEGALAELPRDAVVLSWWSYSTPLWYAQYIEDRRQDLLVVDDRTRIDEGLGSLEDVIEANLGRRPVYLIRYEASELAMLLRQYRLTYTELPAGQGLIRVDGRRTP